MVRRDAAQRSESKSTHAAKEADAQPPPPPPLPEAKTVLVGDGHCVIEYVEVLPSESSTKEALTIVLIPGAPGSYQDFRYIIPLLSKRARVIAVNAPGYGESKAVGVTTRESYAQIGSGPAVKAVSEAVAMLCKDDPNVFILGHSFGGHMAINMVARAEEKGYPIRFKGLALLASVGHKPHRSLAPRTMYVLQSIVVADIPIISRAMALFTRWLMCTVAGFPRSLPVNFFVSSTIRASTAKYDAVMDDVATLAHMPTFHAWSRSDYHIEEDISLTLSEACKGPGPRIAFKRGGHNLQKTRASELNDELLQWMDAVVEGRCVERDATPRVLE
jgi:pimeloyl-ACP methyl ester carboxylesterase